MFSTPRNKKNIKQSSLLPIGLKKIALFGDMVVSKIGSFSLHLGVVGNSGTASMVGVEVMVDGR